MFGFSIPKIVLLLLLIFLIWQIFRVLEKKKKPEGLNNSSEEQNELVENLVECKKCGNFYSVEDSIRCPICNSDNKIYEK
tara:strand:+ start:71 stop:310 length:240 start_codon:yes stop_codon:yes gene_type:complete